MQKSISIQYLIIFPNSRKLHKSIESCRFFITGNCNNLHKYTKSNFPSFEKHKKNTNKTNFSIISEFSINLHKYFHDNFIKFLNILWIITRKENRKNLWFWEKGFDEEKTMNFSKTFLLKYFQWNSNKILIFSIQFETTKYLKVILKNIIILIENY